MDDPIPIPDPTAAALPAASQDAVPLLNYSTPATEGSMVRLRRFNASVDANLARLKLEAAGLQVQLAGETQASMLVGYSTAMGKLDLLVHSDDLEAAKAILKAVDDRRAARFAAEEARLRCPQCGESNSRAYDTRRLWIGVLLFLTGFLCLWCFSGGFIGLIAVGAGVWMAISSASGRRTCRHCGQRWSPDPENPDDFGDDELAQEDDADQDNRR